MLTEKKAIELSVELWEWLTETGKDKSSWPGWNQYYAMHFCFLCEYTSDDSCYACPYCRKFGHCNYGYYDKWGYALTVKTRKKYAGLFLEQLKQL